MARHTALALQIPVTGPLPLPTELTRWSSNRSAFVHAKSKQVFERRVYRQRVDVWDADDKAAEVLVKVLLATGRGQHVNVKVEKFSRDR
jgi:small subunit ribosomal protein S10